MMQMDAPIPIAAAPEAFLKYQDMSCFVGFKPWDRVFEAVFRVRYFVKFVRGFCKVFWVYSSGFRSRNLFMIEIRVFDDFLTILTCF